MKFLVDKNLSPRTVLILNENGYEAYRINEILGDGRIEDIEIFEKAFQDDYWVITIDLDFGEILGSMKSTKAL